MIGNRVMFGCILLFLTLVVTISTAPVVDIQWGEVSINQTIITTEPIAYEDNSSESNQQDIESTTVEYKEETKTTTTTTTAIPEVVTNDLLFAETTEVPVDIDEILKIADRLFAENPYELPSTPTTESPESSQSDKDDDE